MKVILIGKGDNNWQKKFESEADAYKYLYTILVDLWVACSGKSDNYPYDIEDDIIIWKQGKESRYAPGWHWLDKENTLKMPDGKTFYEYANDLYD